MAPLRRQPGVVEVEPANHGADVEGSLHRVELVRVPGTLAPLGTMVPGTIGPSSFVQAGYSSASRPQPERIDQAIARSGVGQLTLDGVVANIIGNVDEDLVVGGRSPLTWRDIQGFLLGSFV